MMLPSPLPFQHLVLLHDNNLLDCKVRSPHCGSIFFVFMLLALVSSLLQDLAVPLHVAYFATMITVYFPSRLGYAS